MLPKSLPIYAPANGRICSTDENASVFSRNRLFGTGPIIEVTSNQLVSPIDGRVQDISSSGDYIQLLSADGYTLTLVMGGGNYFQYHPALTRHVRAKETVTTGQALLTLNQALLRSSDPYQRRLSMFVGVPSDSPCHFSWPTTGSLSMLESFIFEKEV